MSSLRVALGAAVIAFAVVTSAGARADVPPEDGCTGEGTACNNAGPMFNEPGTCQASTCSHYNPSVDGGVEEIACDRCIAAGTSSTSSGSSSSGSTGTSSGGCTVGERGAEGVIAGVMVLAGLGLLFVERRRRVL